jgi:hypothetical protein
VGNHAHLVAAPLERLAHLVGERDIELVLRLAARRDCARRFGIVASVDRDERGSKRIRGQVRN